MSAPRQPDPTFNPTQTHRHALRYPSNKLLRPMVLPALPRYLCRLRSGPPLSGDSAVDTPTLALRSLPLPESGATSTADMAAAPAAAAPFQFQLLPGDGSTRPGERPGVKRHGCVLPNTNIRIRHIASGQWLNIKSKEIKRVMLESTEWGGCTRAYNPYGGVCPPTQGNHPESERPKSDHSAFLRAMTDVNFDDTRLMTAGFADQYEFQNTFTIIPVSDELSHYANHVSGFVPILQRYLYLRRKRELEPEEVSCLCRQLAELNEFMFPLGLQSDSRQKTLRGLQVVETLMLMLRAPFERGFGEPKADRRTQPGVDFDPVGIQSFSSNRPTHLLQTYDQVTLARFEPTAKILVSVCGLLHAYLNGPSRKNELYVCTHIELMWHMYGTAVPVEPVFNELVKDNPVVIAFIKEPEVERVFQLIGNRGGDRNPNHLELLSLLCVQNETRPSPVHQSLICQKMKENMQPGGTVFSRMFPLYQVMIEDKADQLMVRSQFEESPLVTFAAPGLDENHDTANPKLSFFHQQLSLYGKLCLGRNEDSIATLTPLVPWALCLRCATEFRSCRDKTTADAVTGKLTQLASTPASPAPGQKVNIRLPHGVSPKMVDNLLPRSIRRLFFDLIRIIYLDVDPHVDWLSQSDLNINLDEVRRRHTAHRDKKRFDELPLNSGVKHKQRPPCMLLDEKVLASAACSGMTVEYDVIRTPPFVCTITISSADVTFVDDDAAAVSTRAAKIKSYSGSPARTRNEAKQSAAVAALAGHFDSIVDSIREPGIQTSGAPSDWKIPAGSAVQLKAWLRGYLSGSPEAGGLYHAGLHLVMHDSVLGKPQTRLLVSILQVIHCLIRFDYYSDDDDELEFICCRLHAIMDTSNDFRIKPSIGLLKSRHRNHIMGQRQPRRTSFRRFRSTQRGAGERDTDRLQLNLDREIRNDMQWRQGPDRHSETNDSRFLIRVKKIALRCVMTLYDHAFEVQFHSMVLDYGLLEAERKPDRTDTFTDAHPVDVRVSEVGAMQWAKLRRAIKNGISDEIADSRIRKGLSNQYGQIDHAQKVRVELLRKVEKCLHASHSGNDVDRFKKTGGPHARAYFGQLAKVPKWTPLDWSIGVTENFDSFAIDGTQVSSTEWCWRSPSEKKGLKALELPFVNTLVDLANYDSSWLVMNSMMLVNRVFSTVSNLTGKTALARLYRDSASGILPLVARNHAFTRISDQQHISDPVSSDDSTDALHRKAVLCNNPARLAVHSRELSSRIRKFLQQRASTNFDIVSIFEQYTSACKTIPAETAKSGGKRANQLVLLNSGMLDSTLDLMQWAVARRSSDLEELGGCSVHDMFTAAFAFLRALASGFETVQTKLFACLEWLLGIDLRTVPYNQTSPNAHAARLDDLSTHVYSGDTWLHGLGRLVSEVFTNCAKNAINVSDTIVGMIVAQLSPNAGASSQIAAAHAMLGALAIICKDEARGLSISKNQGMVAKHLFRYKGALVMPFLCEADSSAGQRPYRGLGTNIENDPKVQYHFTLVNLLTEMCDDAPALHDTCRVLLSVELIRVVLNSTQIPLTRKAPYIRFLYVVHLTGNSRASVLSELSETFELLSGDICPPDDVPERYDGERAPGNGIFGRFTSLTERVDLPVSNKDASIISFLVDVFCPCLAKLFHHVLRSVVPMKDESKKMLRSAACRVFETIELMLNIPSKMFCLHRLDPSPLLDMASMLATLDGRDDPMNVKIVSIRNRHSRFRFLSEWTKTWLFLNQKKQSDNATCSSGLSALGSALLQAYRGEDTIGAQLNVLAPIVPPGFRSAVAELKGKPYVDPAEPLPLGQEFAMRVYFMTLARARINGAEDGRLDGVLDAVTDMVSAFGHQVGLEFSETYSEQPFSGPVLDALVKLWTRHCGPQSMYRAGIGKSELDLGVIDLLQGVRGVFHTHDTLKASKHAVVQQEGSIAHQDQLVAAGAIPAICGLLSQREALPIRVEGATLLKSVLDDGFAGAQEAFAQHWMKQSGDWNGREFSSGAIQLLTFYKDVLMERRRMNHLYHQREDLRRDMFTRLSEDGKHGRHDTVYSIRSVGSTSSLFSAAFSKNADLIAKESKYRKFLRRPRGSRVAPVVTAGMGQVRPYGGADLINDAPRTVRVLLHVIHSLCEGHHRFFQDCLRETAATGESSNVDNLIGVVGNLLVDASARTDDFELAKGNIPDMLVVCHAVNALTEFAQGHAQNAMQIVESRVPEALARLLGRPAYPDFPTTNTTSDAGFGMRETNDMQARLDESCAELALTLLENYSGLATSAIVVSLSKPVSNRMHHYHLMHTLAELTPAAKRKKLRWNIRADDRGDETKIGPFELAFQFYRVLVTMSGTGEKTESLASGTMFGSWIESQYNQPIEVGQLTYLACTPKIVAAANSLKDYIAKAKDGAKFPTVASNLVRDLRVGPLLEEARKARDIDLPLAWVDQAKSESSSFAPGSMSAREFSSSETSTSSMATASTATRLSKMLETAQVHKFETDDPDVLPYTKLSAMTRTVEFQQGDGMRRVHFYRPPEWRAALPKSVKANFMYKVDRETHSHTLEDMTARFRNVIADMIHRQKMMKIGGRVTRIILQKERWWRHAVLFVTYLLNMIMLLAWSAPKSDFNTVEPEWVDDGVFWVHVFTLLSVAHVCLSALVVTGFFLANTPGTVFAKSSIMWAMSDRAASLASNDKTMAGGRQAALVTSIRLAKKRKKKGGTEWAPKHSVSAASDEMTEDACRMLGAISAEQKMRQEIQRSGGLFNERQDRTEVSLLSGPPLYHCCFFAMSLAGLLHHGAWFSFHLLHVVMGNETMQRTLRSVTKNGVTLLYVFYLLTVIIYMYSLFIFARYRRYMDRNDYAFCDTVYQCFVTSFRLGLLSGGGLGDAVQEDGYSFAETAERSLFDISFFVLITTIGLNVVFGVIVDTFTELRDEKYNIEREKRIRCLICGLSSDEFERVGNSFKDHVRNDHNVWNYLYYFMYLHTRDPNDYSSLEQHVAIDIQSADGQYDFYPVGRSLQFPAPQHTPLSLEETLEQRLVEDNLKRHGELKAQLVQMKAQHEERENALAETLAELIRRGGTDHSEELRRISAVMVTHSTKLDKLAAEPHRRDSVDAASSTESSDA